MDLTRLQGTLPQGIYDQLPGVLSFGIDGPFRCANLLGEAKHECAGFTVFTENLNYSGEALYKLFKSHFSSQAEADTFARKPEKIANRIYSNRLGNSTEESGDGYLYRGRGCLQLTGKSNYKALGEFLGIDLLTDPNLVATQYQLASAAFFFMHNHLWPLCDGGVSEEAITAVRRRVNGGILGIQPVIEYTQHFYSILHGSI